jgi:hypothetical protein
MAYRIMQHRGPDIHVLLYAYAIFLAATSAAPYETILDYTERAHQVC